MIMDFIEVTEIGEVILLEVTQDLTMKKRETISSQDMLSYSDVFSTLLCNLDYDSSMVKIYV